MLAIYIATSSRVNGGSLMLGADATYTAGLVEAEEEMVMVLMMEAEEEVVLVLMMEAAEEVCPRARFYAQDFRQMITATALAIAPIIRLGAAATMRKLQRVAIQHDKYLNAGLSGKGKETLDASLFFEKIEPSRYSVGSSITHTKTRIHCIKHHAHHNKHAFNHHRGK